jgi:hypothetical protein
LAKTAKYIIYYIEYKEPNTRTWWNILPDLWWVIDSLPVCAKFKDDLMIEPVKSFTDMDFQGKFGVYGTYDINIANKMLQYMVGTLQNYKFRIVRNNITHRTKYILCTK